VLERFFDEAAGCSSCCIHHSGAASIGRGLALRKRFCRSFNFELQAAATEDAIVLSLGPQHSFALDQVFQYLQPGTVREILIQAMLDAPVFPPAGVGTRRAPWRSCGTGGAQSPRATPTHGFRRSHGGVFPDQAACLENIVETVRSPTTHW